jgi:hypothetical protein
MPLLWLRPETAQHTLLLAGSIGFLDANNSTCSGDDFACWPRAQVNLLHTLANVSGCTVVLVGDYHYSDLKVIQPGGGHAYAGALHTDKLDKPVYQVRLRSGLWLTTWHSLCQLSCVLRCAARQLATG